MSSNEELLRGRFPFRRTSRDVLRGVGLAFALTIAGAWIVKRFLDLSGFFPVKVMFIFGAGAVLVLVFAERYLSSRTLGPANYVTLARGALTSMLFALIGEQANSGTTWFAVTAASLAVALDGVDGWLARSRRDVSAFGARFDLETDALLIFAAAALAWQFGKAGPWILAAGLMRYIFTASSYLLPWMKRKLPASRRRQAVCVGQELALVICLVPAFPPPISDAIALAGLSLLSISFAIDVAWLVRARHEAQVRSVCRERWTGNWL